MVFGRTTSIVRTPNPALGHDPTADDLDDEHGVYPNDRLAAYEYRKHGTCTGLSPQDYFATVRSVRARLKIPQIFQATSEQMNMAPEDIEQAFMAANPNLHSDNMAVSCSNGELIDVRFSVSRRISRPTPYAGRSRATAANVGRSWSRRCADHFQEGAGPMPQGSGQLRPIYFAKRSLPLVKNPFQAGPESHFACYKGVVVSVE